MESDRLQAVLPLLLRVKGQADIAVRGISMEPALLAGDRITVTAAKQYAIGDIVVFPYKNEGLVVHRLLKIENGRYFCKGDNALRLEDMTASAILGRVTAVNGVPPTPWETWKTTCSLAVHRLFRRLGYDRAAVKTTDLYRAYYHLILQKESDIMRYQKNPALDYIQPDETSLAVFDADSGTTYFFDETGVDILHILEQPRNLESLLQELCTVYRATPELIRADVEEFLADTVAKKVVVIV